MTTLEFPLVGGGGEPVHLARTLNSHGFANIPPMQPAKDHHSVELTLGIPRHRPRTVRIHAGCDGHGAMTVLGSSISVSTANHLLGAVRRMLRMDADLSPFYALASTDPDLSWVCTGAGRMLNSPTVFEDVVKTVCTTNCTWSATVRMVTAIVEHLGERAPGAPAAGAFGRTFPSPDVVAAAGEDFFREVARAGYRGAYLVRLARSVAEGKLNLERYATASPEELPDDQLEKELLALPGVGPYATSCIMMTLGRNHRLILDSWSRPTYAKLVGMKVVKDADIERRFRRYGSYAGLAFWMLITRDWASDFGESDPSSG